MTRKEIRAMQANALKALRAAVKKAIARHHAAGVPAYIWRDGKAVRLARGRPRRKRQRSRRD